MEIPLYLAMTAAEFAFCDVLPEKCAWMACHFSPYGTGITCFPTELPAGSLIILDDSTPLHRHDPKRIGEEFLEVIQKLQPDGILLDFQRPANGETAELAAFLAHKLPCPVCVSDIYANELDCPVFLPPPKLTCRLADHLAPWKGREIWLEAAMECRSYYITEAGCVSHPGTIDHFPFWNDELCCRYRIDLSDNAACFTLCRNRDDLSTLLDQAAAFGVTCGIGLWQELS